MKPLGRRQPIVPYCAGNEFVIANRHFILQMDEIALGAGCNGLVHVQWDFSGEDGASEYFPKTKQCVERFVLFGIGLAPASAALLIKPYQLLGEKNV